MFIFAKLFDWIESVYERRDQMARNGEFGFLPAYAKPTPASESKANHSQKTAPFAAESQDR